VVRLAGPVEPGYEAELSTHVAAMERAGASVELRRGRQTKNERAELFGRSRCVLVTYVGHHGMSRVFIEGAAAGAPVVAGADGLIGHLVRTYHLGVTVDLSDPVSLREAIVRLCNRRNETKRYQPDLERFAARFRPRSSRMPYAVPYQMDDTNAASGSSGTS
jgi:glycosyltransferase involved in cell wall biosynthesis